MDEKDKSISISPKRDNSEVAKRLKDIELIKNNATEEHYGNEYTSSGGSYFNTMCDSDWDDVEERPVEDVDITDLIIDTLEVQIKWMKYLKQKQ